MAASQVRRAAKIDANQSAIVEALRARGWGVQSLAAVGNGCPDLLVAKGERTLVVECKAGSGFTPRQKAWHRDWPGKAYVANSVEDALLIVGERTE